MAIVHETLFINTIFAADKNLNIFELNYNFNDRVCAFDLMGLGALSLAVQLIIEITIF